MTARSAEQTAGLIVGTFFVTAIGGALAWLLWPAGIADTTLAALTVGAIFRALAAVGTGLITLVVVSMAWL